MLGGVQGASLAAAPREGRGPVLNPGARAAGDSPGTPGSRASTGGRRPERPTPLARAVRGEATPVCPRSPRRTRREGAASRAAGGQQALPPQPPWPVRLPARARRRTSWKAPGWAYLTGARRGRRLLHRSTETAGRKPRLGSQHPPVRPRRPPKELPDPPASSSLTRPPCRCGWFLLRLRRACALPCRRVSWEL